MGRSFLDVIGVILLGVLVFFLLGVFCIFIMNSTQLGSTEAIYIILPVTLLTIIAYVLTSLRIVFMIPERAEALDYIAENMERLLKIQYAIALENTNSEETRALLKEIGEIEKD